LIIEGSCKLQKKKHNAAFSPTIQVKTVETGEIEGLESINENSKYEHTLIVKITIT